MPSSFLLTFQAWYKLMIYTSGWSLFLVFLTKGKLLWGSQVGFWGVVFQISFLFSSDKEIAYFPSFMIK